ncbi:hypothetical protein U9M48_003818, partial [Paspalum notatum var. saurae]
ALPPCWAPIHISPLSHIQFFINCLIYSLKSLPLPFPLHLGRPSPSPHEQIREEGASMAASPFLMAPLTSLNLPHHECKKKRCCNRKEEDHPLRSLIRAPMCTVDNTHGCSSVESQAAAISYFIVSSPSSLFRGCHQPHVVCAEDQRV